MYWMSPPGSLVYAGAPPYQQLLTAGITPLHAAAMFDAVECARFLLWGADPGVSGDAKTTPLMVG